MVIPEAAPEVPQRIPNVNSVRGRDGIVRHYFRKAGMPPKRLRAEYGSPKFLHEVRLAGARNEPTKRQLRGLVHVYFIQDEASRSIKIGSALNIEKRLRAFQTAWHSPVRLLGSIPEPIGGGLERTLHRTFKRHRVRGEWFSDHPEILAYIQRCASPAAATQSPTHGVRGGGAG